LDPGSVAVDRDVRELFGKSGAEGI
jgi:hypothetical protein